MTSAAWAEVEVCTLLSAILVIWVFLYQLLHALYQRHRSVRVSQVKPSNCFRCLEKLVLPSIFDTILSFIMTWNLQSYPTTVLNERTWPLGGGGQNILWSLLHIFRGSKPQPQDPRPCTQRELALKRSQSPCSVPEKWHFDITDTLIVRFTYFYLQCEMDQAEWYWTDRLRPALTWLIYTNCRWMSNAQVFYIDLTLHAGLTDEVIMCDQWWWRIRIIMGP